MREWTNLGGEAAVADGALEGALLGVAAVVDLQRRVARERLVADVARGVAAHCTQTHRSLPVRAPVHPRDGTSYKLLNNFTECKNSQLLNKHRG